MLDVDGTLIPNNRNGLPSNAVIKAIKKANKKIHVGIATARPLSVLENILSVLPLSGPSIINGGSQIIDLPSQKILKEQPIEIHDVLKICTIAKQFKIKPIIINDTDEDIELSKDYKPYKPFQVYMPDVSSKNRDEFLQTISHISHVSVHKTVSWRRGGIDIFITHSLATKHHGVLEVARILGITPKEIIGVGDGYNDFSLLLSCGLKIAMGNAISDLKAIADYTAPSVEKDGLVKVIKKFVLGV
ncbi:MAG: hypothetical protein A3F31_00640 [Candidatus Levybacteria bacterium RIFCSPHIGHO2_12_FULL_38_12]|nr:MAG: hypothetical protein A2770_02935 [Candidatus Levybacteria bacterium RIFCSPHIGHO2_01_FULL_38_12]OGH22770.1 MAG: hypothetical protein A3F31_00640 [Candidatus Levybacteria bacterium RIFCSPHIGHO2_12_FULL_38_12]OGH45023.1 MAG: hypothetical protein A3J14_04075 [Candidatus Levybacteria bacterium RIFCSPLOWO2_02_FULL_37_18]OGH51802.1 MAG: hypothetical protein A3G13_03300 [Candidatus Levybacteria bacterium RIFCSPLOWO2_12_FULL_37_7]